MPVEQREDGSLVFGYLDTGSARRAEASDTVLVRAGQPYQAELRPHRFGALSACDIRGEQEVRVQPRHSRSVRPQGPLIGLLLSGWGRLEQDGHQATLAPGGFVLYTAARPFRLDLGGSYRYVVWSPEPAVAGAPPAPAPPPADPQLPHSAAGRVLAATLAELAHQAPELGPVSRHEMGDHVTGMIRTLLRGRPSARRDGALDRVLAWIDAHLDEELTPASIAAAHHVSVRYVHGLFQQHGDTLGEYVRRRRLARIRQDLTDARLAHIPAYALAARWGLREASHFSKLFRAEFGLSPRELRRRTAAAGDAAEGDAAG